MTRYEACRKIGLDPLSSGLTTFMHWIRGIPEGYIGLLHTVITYDVNADPDKEMVLEDYE